MPSVAWGEVYHTAELHPIYDARVWPVEVKDMQAVASQLNPYLEDVRPHWPVERLWVSSSRSIRTRSSFVARSRNGQAPTPSDMNATCSTPGDDMDYIQKFI